MPLNPVINPNHPRTSNIVHRPKPQVHVGAPTAHDQRANAMKDRLRGAPQHPAPPKEAPSSGGGGLRVTPSTTRPSPAVTTEPAAPAVALATSAPAAPPGDDGGGNPAHPAFEALSRKERHLRKQQLELKAAQEAWKQEQSKYVSVDQLTGPDALKVLTERGLSYDKIVELQLNAIAPDPQQPLLDKISQLEQRLAKVDETFKTRDDVQEQQALRQIKSDVQLLVDSDPAYETIAATESVGEVVDLIHKVFLAEGTVLPVDEAARLVEDKLTEREFARLQKLSSLSKLKARLQPVDPKPTSSTTLTNAGSRHSRPLSSRERAIARLKGEL